MKKSLIFLSSLLFVGSFAHAQTSSGNMMAGGGIQFSSSSRQSGNANDQSSFRFSPSFGYFVSEDLAVGASVDFSTSRTGTGDAKTVSNSFGFGPFARYYIFTSNENFAFFGQAGLNFTSRKSDPPAGGVTKGSAISFSLFPGAAYFFNEHWALELAITGFRIESSDPNTANDNDKRTEVDFGVHSFSPSLGFRYHF